MLRYFLRNYSLQKFWKYIFLEIFETAKEAAIVGVLQKKMFWKILQNPQETTCIGVSFLIKLKSSELQLR